MYLIPSGGCIHLEEREQFYQCQLSRRHKGQERLSDLEKSIFQVKLPQTALVLLKQWATTHAGAQGLNCSFFGHPKRPGTLGINPLQLQETTSVYPCLPYIFQECCNTKMMWKHWSCTVHLLSQPVCIKFPWCT